MTVDEKRNLELKTMRQIIHIYCSHKHAMKQEQLCPKCNEVWNYAKQRIEACPHMEVKTFCSVCKTHCYEPTYREQIREIMRYSGPRLFWKAPFMVLRHMYLEWKDRCSTT